MPLPSPAFQADSPNGRITSPSPREGPGRSGKVERGEGRTQSAARLPLVLPRDKKQSESDRETNNVLQHLKVRSIEVRNFWESTFLNSPRPACF